ncbi:MAG: homocysteine S-methyltransferase family protein [Ignavibacteria bacterium]|nr:homocysteine S-methyltransferase family protein [Ignavibacteria bacterium]
MQEKFALANSPLWSTESLIKHPSEILQLHAEYVEAGADIITTTTFRTNPLTLELSGNTGLDCKELVRKAVDLAKEATWGKKVFIAGSNPPAEDCYQKKRSVSLDVLKDNHIRHIDALAEQGVDIILNETQSHYDEIMIIAEHCAQLNIPWIMSLFFDRHCKILSGESVTRVVKDLAHFNPSAVSFNCIKAEYLFNLLGKMKLPASWGYYLNCGNTGYSTHVMDSCLTPQQYLFAVMQFLPYKPAFIGSCCGSTPEHTRLLRKLIDEENNN